MKSGLGARLIQARKLRGITDQAELARLAKVTRSAINQVESGLTKSLRGSTLLSIAKALRVRAEWLESGQPPMELGIGEAPAVYGEGTSKDYDLVSRVTGALLSAGPGKLVFEHEEVDSSHAFKKDWLRKRGLRANKCRIMEVTGDSMTPMLPPGCVVLVDLNDHSIILDGKLYAIVVDDEVRVKRLHKRADGGIDIVSDNAKYPTQTLDHAKLARLQIVGRIRWSSVEL